MATPLLPGDPWAVVAPLLPPGPPKPKGGRPRVPDRAALTGILSVPKPGIPWEMPPPELGCGSGVTCRRRRRGWQRAGVRDALHRALLDRLGEADRIDWSRASLGGASVPAKGGGEAVGPNPTDRGKAGAKRHPITDRNGVPLAALLTAANRHDSVVFEDPVDAVPPTRTPAGRRRRRPAKLRADKGYDHPRRRAALRKRRIEVRIARRGVGSSDRLGRHRWVVERTRAWLARYRRLTVRHERRADIHQAFLPLGRCLIRWNRLQDGF